MSDVPITPAGYEALNVELKRRQQQDRPNIVRAIAEARAHGDLSENAEYSAAKEAQGLNEGRIQELESMIARAKIIDPSKLSGNKAMFGAIVTLESDDGKEKKLYQIVGEPEADVAQGRIAITSPLARAMIGKSVGDSVDVHAPGGTKIYEIVAITFA
jgi:transcription elongation factor GreA